MKFKFAQLLTYLLLVGSSSASASRSGEKNLSKAFEGLVPNSITDDVRDAFLDKIDYIGDASKRYIHPNKPKG